MRAGGPVHSVEAAKSNSHRLPPSHQIVLPKVPKEPLILKKPNEMPQVPEGVTYEVRWENEEGGGAEKRSPDLDLPAV